MKLKIDWPLKPVSSRNLLSLKKTYYATYLYQLVAHNKTIAYFFYPVKTLIEVFYVSIRAKEMIESDETNVL